MRRIVPFFFALFWAELVGIAAEPPALADAISSARVGTDVCLIFVGKEAVERRTALWKSALEKMPRQYVLKWISGQAKPPALATQEAMVMRTCLIERLALDASQNRVMIDGAGVALNEKGMKTLAKRAKKRPRQVAAQLVRSHYRAASTQSAIWKRKFRFTGRAFNIISSNAAKKCALTPATVWRPGNAKHKRCWRSLTTEEREQEILLASSAPGISRHHWGTDFDIFGLTPRQFVAGRKLHDEYTWMLEHALTYGITQPYSNKTQRPGPGYMEERWHWSYAPIADALTQFAYEHQAELQTVLFEQWTQFEKKWGITQGPYFNYIRRTWRDYMFNVYEGTGRKQRTTTPRKSL